MKSTIDIEAVEKQIVQLYQDNVTYLQENHPELFKTLQYFEYALENEEIEENYALELKDEGYFDIKDLKKDKWLYGEDTNAYSKSLSEKVSLKKAVSSFEGFSVIDVQNVEEAKKNDKDGISGIYPMMSYYLENSREDEEVLSIRKFIFLGVGLGLHIPLIDAKICAEDYLVIEDDFELFRLSLFLTPYCDIAKYTRFHFSIAQYENDFTSTMNSFLAANPFYNRHIKFIHFATHNTNKIKQIQSSILTQTFIVFPYGIQLRKLLFPLNYLNKYKILNLKKHFKESCFSERPLLLLTAGPSLGKNIEWLKDNHQKFLIVAVSATLKILYKYNIVPDIVTHLDGFKTSLPHLEGFPVKEFLKNSSIILGDFASLELHDIFSKEQIYRLSDREEYFQGFAHPTTPCVGSFSFLAALQFNATEIYLLGLDLALDPSTGATHSSFHNYTGTVDTATSNSFNPSMSLRGTTMKIKGNFRDEVTTTPIFDNSIHSLFIQIKDFKEEQQNIYNLNDGAFFEGTQPLDIKEVPLQKYPIIDKSKLSIEISKTLNTHSRTKLNAQEIEILQQRLQQAKELQDILLNYTQTITYANTDKYINGLGALYEDIVAYYPQTIFKLTQTIDQFFFYTYSLIIDFFNTKNIPNSKRHMKKFDKMMQKELSNIINKYIKELEKFLKEKAEVS